MHLHRLCALYEVRLPAAATEEALQLFMRDTSKYCRIGDLVTVQVEDRKYRTICYGVQELVGMPCSSQRACLSLTVTYYTSSYKVGVIEYCTEAVSQRITKLAALVDGAGSLGCNVRGDSAGERELLEQLLHTLNIS